MSKLMDAAKAIRMLAARASEEGSPMRLEAMDIAASLENQAAIADNRYAQSMQLQDIGRSAFESIAEMVAALRCDYGRLEELRGHRGTLKEEFDAMPANAGVDFANWVRNQDLLTSEDVDELAELEEAAGDCESREDAETRIQEGPLAVEVRTGWREMWSHGDSVSPEEFCILLGTGGPATRIIGELNEHGEPTRARLQAQDWGTPWTDYIGGDRGTPWADYIGGDRETLLTYCRCFYFGEG